MCKTFGQYSARLPINCGVHESPSAHLRHIELRKLQYILLDWGEIEVGCYHVRTGGQNYWKIQKVLWRIINQIHASKYTFHVLHVSTHAVQRAYLRFPGLCVLVGVGIQAYFKDICVMWERERERESIVFISTDAGVLFVRLDDVCVLACVRAGTYTCL